MSEFEPPAPGWWRASDDNWYPPETHPDYVAPGPVPAPPQPQPPRPADLAVQASDDTAATPWWRRWWALLAAAVLALLVAAGIAGGGDDEPVGAAEQIEDSAEPAPANDPEPAADDAEPDDAEDETDRPADEPEPPPAGDPTVGTRDNPLGYDALVPVTFDAFGDADGSVWNMMISEPRDITAAVLAENPFNDEPPEGVLFVGFDVEMTLASANKEPLSPGFNFSWEILGGATSAVYDPTTLDDVFGCGVTPDGFDRYAEVFVAGTLRGTVCIPLPVEDLEAPGTVVAMNFRGERIVFAPNGASPAPVELAERGDAPGDVELAYSTEVPVTFDAFGDADRSVWNVIIGPPGDIEEAILAANPFNDEAPEGISFVGFDVTMTLASAGKVPLSPGFNFTWEILGGSTAAVYSEGTLDDIFGCGVWADEFDDFAEVFVGGTLEGQVCIPVPTEDLDHPDTQVSMNFSGDRTLFFVDGAMPQPAPIEDRVDAAAVGESLPFEAETELAWDSFGDADRSTWTTSLSNYRDMTAEIAAENPFNDPPPEGAVFVGFDVEMTLLDAEKEPLSTGFNFTWEVLGGATKRVFGQGTLGDSFGCGVTPDDFDQFAEVFVGGTLSGTVCIPLPASDLLDPNTRIALNFSGERVTFDPTE